MKQAKVAELIKFLTDGTLPSWLKNTSKVNIWKFKKQYSTDWTTNNNKLFYKNKPVISDEEKQDFLQKIYENPATMKTGREKLYAHVSDISFGITQVECNVFLGNQESHQLTKKVFTYPKIKSVITKKAFHRIQIDLIDVSKDAYWNKNTNFLFTCIDCYSRYAFCVPLKDKTMESSAKAFELIIEEIREKFKILPKIVSSDNGPEFKNELFDKLKQKYNFIQSFSKSYTSNTQGFIEAFNSTLRRLIRVYITQNSTKEYVSKLQDLLKNYNSSFHTITKFKPIDLAQSNAPEQVKEKALKNMAKKIGSK